MRCFALASILKNYGARILTQSLLSSGLFQWDNDFLENIEKVDDETNKIIYICFKTCDINGTPFPTEKI